MRFGINKKKITVIALAGVVIISAGFLVYKILSKSEKSTVYSNNSVNSEIEASIKQQINQNNKNGDQKSAINNAKSLAYQYFYDKQYQASAHTLEKIVDFYPSSEVGYDVYELLGLNYKKMGKNDMAVSNFDKAIMLLKKQDKKVIDEVMSRLEAEKK